VLVGFLQVVNFCFKIVFISRDNLEPPQCMFIHDFLQVVLLFSIVILYVHCYWAYCNIFLTGYLYSGLKDGRIVRINITDESYTEISRISEPPYFHCGK